MLLGLFEWKGVATDMELIAFCSTVGLKRAWAREEWWWSHWLGTCVHLYGSLFHKDRGSEAVRKRVKIFAPDLDARGGMQQMQADTGVGKRDEKTHLIIFFPPEVK